MGMLRMAQIVISGHPHDVVQRGSNRQHVFSVDDDRGACFEFLLERCERVGFNVLGYRLLDVPLPDDADY